MLVRPHNIFTVITNLFYQCPEQTVTFTHIPMRRCGTPPRPRARPLVQGLNSLAILEKIESMEELPSLAHSSHLCIPIFMKRPTVVSANLIQTIESDTGLSLGTNDHGNRASMETLGLNPYSEAMDSTKYIPSLCEPLGTPPSTTNPHVKATVTISLPVMIAQSMVQARMASLRNRYLSSAELLPSLDERTAFIANH
jgi:hypothetical protein